VTEFERGTRVDGVEEILDSDAVGLALRDERGQPFVNDQEFLREGCAGGRGWSRTCGSGGC